MNKKFKELRMFILCLVMFVVFLCLTAYAYFNSSKVQMIGLSMLSLITFILLMFRYKHILMEDAMIIYEWKIIAMLPIMIDYQDITSVYQVSSHHVVVEHKKKSHVYVWNSQKFIDAYTSLSQVNKNA